jgi:hypothetical protein
MLIFFFFLFFSFFFLFSYVKRFSRYLLAIGLLRIMYVMVFLFVNLLAFDLLCIVCNGFHVLTCTRFAEWYVEWVPGYFTDVRFPAYRVELFSSYNVLTCARSTVWNGILYCRSACCSLCGIVF